MGAVQKKAIILARVSTAGQAEEELPIPSQLEACRAKARELGADVLREFVEEGVSGRKFRRDVLEEAIEHCELFEVDYFIVWNPARFARNRAVAAWLKLRLRRGGTEMVYVSENIDTSTDHGWLLEWLYELFDENYSRSVSKDTLRSMMKNARDGFFNGGALPYGYVAVPEGKRRRLAVVEDEASVVRHVFAECLRGAGAKTIAQWLNSSGVRRRGKLWTKNTVSHMLANTVYTGKITFNRTDHAAKAKRPQAEWVQVKSHPAIVSDSDFEAVQSLMAKRAPVKEGGSPSSQFLFTGLMKCGTCGRGMQIRTGTGRGGKVYSYYECSGSIRGLGCPSRLLAGRDMDEYLLDALMERALSVEQLRETAEQIDALRGTWAKERAARREFLVGQLREAEARRRNLFDVLEQHGRDAPNLGDLTVRLRELNEQIKALEASLTELENFVPADFRASDEAIEELAAFVAETIHNSEPKKVREFLGLFVERVVVERDQVVIHMIPGRIFGGDDPVRSKRNWLPE
jgi:site-specific DNA recombinase